MSDIERARQRYAKAHPGRFKTFMRDVERNKVNGMTMKQHKKLAADIDRALADLRSEFPEFTDLEIAKALCKQAQQVKMNILAMQWEAKHPEEAAQGAAESSAHEVAQKAANKAVKDKDSAEWMDAYAQAYDQEWRRCMGL
jgi:hypothetical protein